MDLLTALKNNSKLIPDSIEEVIESKKKFSFEFDEMGIEFNFIFEWNIENIIFDIIIGPKLRTTDKRLILNFDSSFKKDITNLLDIDFIFGSIVINNFNGTDNTLTNIEFFNPNNSITLLIRNVVAHKIKINGANSAIIEGSGIQNFEIRNVKSLTIENNTSTYKNETFKVTDSDKVKLSNLRGKGIEIIGKVLSAEFCETEIESLKLNEVSFDIFKLEDTSADNFSIIKPNQMGLKGLLDISNSDSSIKFKLSNAIICCHNKFLSLFYHNDLRNRIVISLNDDKFNPKEVIAHDVVWKYRGITTNKKYPEAKRRFINSFKNYYEDKDILNTQLFNSFEKKWYWENNSYSFPLLMARLSNNFGLSLVLPIIWISVSILLESTLLLIFSGDCYPILLENWGVFFNLINPTHKTSIFLEVIENDCVTEKIYTNLLPLIDNVFRIFIAYMIFQFANAFRYKYKLR